MNILIVDDDAAIREISARILMNAGYEVNVAEDGEAAWEAVGLTAFDLIITDQNMPRLSGTGLIARLHGAGLRMPVIMITGGSVDIPFEDGTPDCFLTKPFNFRALLGEMNRLLSLAAV